MNFRNLVLFKNSKSLHTDHHSAYSSNSRCPDFTIVTSLLVSRSVENPSPDTPQPLLNYSSYSVTSPPPSRGQGSEVGYLWRPAAVCEHVLRCGEFIYTKYATHFLECTVPRTQVSFPLCSVWFKPKLLKLSSP